MPFVLKLSITLHSGCCYTVHFHNWAMEHKSNVKVRSTPEDDGQQLSMLGPQPSTFLSLNKSAVVWLYSCDASTKVHVLRIQSLCQGLEEIDGPKILQLNDLPVRLHPMVRDRHQAGTRPESPSNLCLPFLPLLRKTTSLTS
jgi:hypothetical protein